MKKGIAIAATFIGGIAVGATLGLLFAPEKGVDQRRKIKEALRKHGIKIGKGDLDELVDDIDAATDEAE